MTRKLAEGLYEEVLTPELRVAADLRLREGLLVDVQPLERAETNALLTRHLAHEILAALSGIKDDRGAAERIRLCNELLAVLQRHGGAPERAVDPSAEALFSVHRHQPPRRPQTPMSVSTLLTGADEEPRLGYELEQEFASADRVDLLVSFVTWPGWRLLRGPLEALAARGKPLRLITTTYTGATDAEAVQAIAELPNTQVRISYDGRRSRLHAKAWLFHRESGLSTAYVGSANLSRAALSGGLEWTVKLTQADLPDAVQKFAGTFETLWNDETEFEPYDATVSDHLARLREALARESGTRRVVTSLPLHFDLRPFPYQQEVLDRLTVERHLHDRRRNLVVAATGTGKTFISAFDYERQVAGRVRPRLLFVAHREELLQQSLHTFRAVLRDGAFGELLASGSEPRSFGHLFTTVQSFRSRRLDEKFAADHWDYVVVDECHHSTAETYSALVERLTPRLLVGLTATPERADGESILPYFGGRAAAELRLWHALDRELLAPFEYYGLHDNVDLRGVEWRRGGYDLAGLETLYTGNDRRAELVLEQFHRLRGDLHGARALGFCVSVAHAEFMARKFAALGVPALAVHGGSSEEVRGDARRRLEAREVNVLFTCDLYNEGVDLPFVDTLLLLRPTTSATVFLQQLGRGLRLHKDKPSCLVLDFIGQNRREFRFDRLLSAMTGLSRGQLQQAVVQGFPTLPSGCHLSLDPIARDLVVENLRQTLRAGTRRLRQELQEVVARRGRPPTLAEFLEDTGRPVGDVYQAGGWTVLRRKAAILPGAATDAEAELSGKLRRLLHLDDAGRIHLVRELAKGTLAAAPTEPGARRRLLMLGYQLWHAPTDLLGAEDVLARLRAHPCVLDELAELADVLDDNIQLTRAAALPADWALELHRTYGRREILTAVGHWDERRKPPSREGLLRLGKDTELFFVTLVKDEGRFSPTTRYRDFAISPALFHWQSQSTTGEDSPTGRGYRDQASNGRQFHLFVRKHQDEPYTFLGPLRFRGHEGTRPMSITWELEVPMPAALFQRFATLVAA